MQFTSTTTSISIINQTSNLLTGFTLLCRKQDVPVSKTLPEQQSFCESCRSPDCSYKILALKGIKQLLRQMSAVNIGPSNLASIVVTQMINTHPLLPSQRLCTYVFRVSFALSELCPLGQLHPTQI